MKLNFFQFPKKETSKSRVFPCFLLFINRQTLIKNQAELGGLAAWFFRVRGFVNKIVFASPKIEKP
jgi:hypothetical protein